MSVKLDGVTFFFEHLFTFFESKKFKWKLQKWVQLDLLLFLILQY